MRALMWIAGLTLAAAACDRGEQTADASQFDPSQLTNSSGEVALADGGSMSFSITSERYKQWDAARRAFPKSLITRFGQVLQPRSPTERSIANAVALLESNPAARGAIERAGLSVRGFVEITVALEQQMMLASSRGAVPEDAPAPETYPLSMDSGYYPPPVQPYPGQPYPAQPYPGQPLPVTPAPVTPLPPATQPPVTPYPSPDTARRDTLFPAPRPAPRRDTVLPPPRPDTQPVRRDTVVAPKPAPPDTSPDTSRVGPTPVTPDSIGSA